MIAFLIYTGAAVVLGVLCLVIGAVCADRIRATFLRPSGAHASLPGEAGTSARRTPPAVETPAAAERADEHPKFGRLLDTPPEGIEVVRGNAALIVGGTNPTPVIPAGYAPWRTQEFPAVPDQRPVSGRHLRTQPRQTPPALSGDRLAADRAAAQAAGQRAGADWQPKPPELLQQVLGALRKLDVNA